MTAGAPFAGLVIDNAGPAWAFAAAGAVGAGAVLVGWVVTRSGAAHPTMPAEEPVKA